MIRIGDVAEPDGLKATDIPAGNPAATARAIDKLQSAAARQADARPCSSPPPTARTSRCPPRAGRRSPATRCCGPAATRSRPRPRRRSQAHGKPQIYVLGPEDVISEAVVERAAQARQRQAHRRAGPGHQRDRVRPLHRRRASAGASPTRATASCSRPTARALDAAAAAPLSASGTYGPLLLVTEAQALPQALQDYLLDIQPGYDKDPVRGVYNHGWLMGDEAAISADVQSRIDTLLEIQPVDTGGD